MYTTLNCGEVNHFRWAFGCKSDISNSHESLNRHFSAMGDVRSKGLGHKRQGWTTEMNDLVSFVEELLLGQRFQMLAM